MAGDDKTKKGDEKFEDSEAFKKLNKTVQGLAILVQQGQVAATKSQGNFDTLIAKMDKMSVVKPIKKDVDPEAINDLENDEFLKIVLKEMGKLVDDKVGKVSDRIDVTDGRVSQTEVKKQIIDLNKSDFFDWTDEIKNLSKNNPALNVKQLYNLARDGNESKAAELDEKYAEKKDDKDKPGFLGLMPTSGVTAEGDEKLTNEEAMDKAWDETMDQFPGLATLGEG